MTADRLAALLDAVIHNIEREGEPATVPAIAARLAAAGVTVAPQPALDATPLSGGRDPEACTVCGTVDCGGNSLTCRIVTVAPAPAILGDKP